MSGEKGRPGERETWGLGDCETNYLTGFAVGKSQCLK